MMKNWTQAPFYVWYRDYQGYTVLTQPILHNYMGRFVQRSDHWVYSNNLTHWPGDIVTVPGV